MCTTVLLDGEEIRGLHRLRAAVGADNVVIRDGYDLGEADSCLCPVDMESTAARLNIVDRRDDHDSMMHIWNRLEAA